MDTQPIPNQQISKKLPLVQIILAVLAIVVVGELIWAGLTLFKGSKTSNQLVNTITKTTQPTPVAPAQISLKSDQQTVKVGDKLTVNILVDTGGKSTDGTDVILNFDPKTLVVDASSSGKPVNTGTIYASYPVNTLDPVGKVSVSGITNVGSSFSGQGLLGSVTFRAIAPGSTTVAIDFKLGSTTDSNIIESKTAKDVLTNVNNLSLNITP